MDAAWPRIADAVIRPVLGPLTDRLKKLLPVDDPANSRGSSYFSGWYSYVVSDLDRTIPEFCGGGDPRACQSSLWNAPVAAGNELVASQGRDPSQWRADATRERITFGFLPKTGRWTNRPTFQQAITFDSHRPR